MEDDEALHTVCFRCGSSKPLLRKEDLGVDVCLTCEHPFIRCMINYDVIPLVEFKSADNFDESQMIEFMQSAKKGGKTDTLFHDAIDKSLARAENGYKAIEIGKDVLETIDRADVFTLYCSKTNAQRYYKNMIPDIGIAVCHNCSQFFHEEEFEYHYLQKGGCPICKTELITKVSCSSSVTQCAV